MVSKISRYLITYFHMASDTIVKHLDVFKDHLPGLLTSGKAIVMQAFRFDRTEEALHMVFGMKIVADEITFLSEAARVLIYCAP